MIISVTSLKGSPGATTVSLLLAKFWPGDSSRVVLEADPDGGVIAARLYDSGITWNPGLIDLATSARGDRPFLEALDSCSQQVGEGVSVVTALPTPGTVSSALASFTDNGLTELAASDRVVIADIGRNRPDTMNIVRHSQTVLIVLRASLDSVAIVQPTIDRLSKHGVSVGLVVLGSSSKVDEVSHASGVTNIWEIPDNQKAAELIWRRGVDSRATRKGPLGRAANLIASELAKLTGPPQPVPLGTKPNPTDESFKPPTAPVQTTIITPGPPQPVPLGTKPNPAPPGAQPNPTDSVSPASGFTAEAIRRAATTTGPVDSSPALSKLGETS